MEVVFNGLWSRGLRHGPRDVGKALVGKGLALFGPVGQCAFAHSIHAVERSRKHGPHGELFFFPFEERSDGLQ